jgi:hypothetical protein
MPRRKRNVSERLLDLAHKLRKEEDWFEAQHMDDVVGPHLRAALGSVMQAYNAIEVRVKEIANALKKG